MYNFHEYELNLDNQLLAKYSELTGEEVDSEALNWTLARLGRIMTKSETFEDAVNTVGLQELARLIEKALKEEIVDLFGEEV